MLPGPLAMTRRLPSALAPVRLPVPRARATTHPDARLRHVTWAEVCRQRLARSHLLHPAAPAEALLEAIGEALDGRCLTREELAQQVAHRIGSWVREPLSSTWGVLLGPAAYTGRLCFGPSRGSKVTFVRADQWAGTVAWKELDSA